MFMWSVEPQPPEPVKLLQEACLITHIVERLSINQEVMVRRVLAKKPKTVQSIN